MPARRAERLRVSELREVRIEVEVNRARDVALEIRRAARAGLAQIPACIDDHEVRILELVGEIGDRDQGRARRH